MELAIKFDQYTDPREHDRWNIYILLDFIKAF